MIDMDPRWFEEEPPLKSKLPPDHTAVVVVNATEKSQWQGYVWGVKDNTESEEGRYALPLVPHTEDEDVHDRLTRGVAALFPESGEIKPALKPLSHEFTSPSLFPQSERPSYVVTLYDEEHHGELSGEIGQWVRPTSLLDQSRTTPGSSQVIEDIMVRGVYKDIVPLPSGRRYRSKKSMLD